MQIVGQELRTRNGKLIFLFPIMLYIFVGCTKPRNFFERIVNQRLYYRIDFIDVKIEDVFKEMKANENQIASIDLSSSIPDPEAPSNYYVGPGLFGYSLDTGSSTSLKELLLDSMETHGSKEIDFPIDVHMNVILKDGSGFGFSLNRRDKFESNVFHMKIFEKFSKPSEYQGSKRAVDVSKVQDKEVLLKNLIGILRSLGSEPDPKPAAWFANIYPEVEPIVLSNKK